jgi:hypothetical protein
MTRVKRIRSHTGMARYLATVTDGGWIVRQDVPTPYASGPDHLVHLDPTHGAVIIAETAHKVYDIFAVPSTVTIFATDAEASVAFAASRS